MVATQAMIETARDARGFHLVMEFTPAERQPQVRRAGASGAAAERKTYMLRSEQGTYQPATFTWDEALERELEHLRRIDYDPAVVQRLGERLHAFVAQVGWSEHEATIARAVAAQRPCSLTIRSAAAEIYRLPWELLVLKSTGQQLGKLPGMLVRYEWPGTETRPADEPQPEGGRVALAWAEAGDTVPWAEHARVIEEACERGHYPFDRARDVLARASLGKLERMLARARDDGEPIAVLHLLCHGAPRGQTYGLALEDEQGEHCVVGADALRSTLGPHAQTLRLVVLSVCDSANAGEPGNALGSVAQTLHREGIEAVIASRFPLSKRGSICFGRALLRGLCSDARGLEDAFLDARRALAIENPKYLDWASMQLYARCADTPRYSDGDDTRPLVVRPYRGLLPFRAQHERFFFGRDEERAEILSDLMALQTAGLPRFLVVAGASGTGKSSVVLGAALPALVRGGAAQAAQDSDDDETDATRWEHAIMRPGRQPLAGLDRALATRKDPSRPFLVVVDQFEELFTHTDAPAERRAFVQRLWSLCAQDSGISCIVTIRVDFLGHCGDIPVDSSGLRLDAVAYDEAHRVFIAQMSPAQLLEAIERPARAVGLRLQDGLPQRMLADVEGEPGALPLLAYTLDLLWQRRTGRVLTADAYDELGGVIGALQRKADTLVDELKGDALRQARRLFVRLVDMGEDHGMDTRRRVARAEIQPGEEEARRAFDDVVERFVTARLVVRDESGSHSTLEVAHEALIRKWARLRAWLSADREKLSRTRELSGWVKEFDAHRTLLSGPKLVHAKGIVDDYADDVEPLAHELIAASQAAERRRLLWRTGTLISAIASTLIIAALALLTWHSEKDAREATKLAEAATEDQRRATQETQLALAIAQAQKLQRRDPCAALTILRETRPGASRKEQQAWRQLAMNLLSIPPCESFAVDADRVTNAASFSPDGRRIAVGLDDGTARIWTLGGDEEPLSIGASASGFLVKRVEWSEDGDELAIYSVDISTRPITDSDNRFGGVRVSVYALDGAALFERDGVSFGMLNRDGTQLAYVPAAPAPEVSAPSAADPAYAAPANAGEDEGKVTEAGGARATTAFVRTLKSGAEMALEGHTAQIESAVFSHDGARVATSSVDGTVRVWTLSDPRTPVVLDHREPVLIAAFGPDDAQLATLTPAQIRVWDLTARKPAIASRRPTPDLSGLEDTEHMVRPIPRWEEMMTFERAPMARVIDGYIEITHGDHRQWTTRIPEHTRLLHRIALSDGATKALTTVGRFVHVWSLGRVPALATRVPDVALVSAAFSADDAAILLLRSGGVLRAPRGRLDFEWLPPPARLSPTAISRAWLDPRGERVLAVVDGALRAWPAGATDIGAPLPVRADPAQVLALGRDGAFVTGAADDNENGIATLWTERDPRRLAPPFRAHYARIDAAAFTRDGARLVTLSAPMRSVKIWNLRGGVDKPASNLRPEDEPTALAIDDDGDAIALGTRNGDVEVWRGHPLPLRFPAHRGPIDALAIDPDGERMITVSGGEALLWTLDVDSMIDRMWESAPFCIPPEERVEYLRERQDESRADYERCKRELARRVQDGQQKGEQ